jgi:hypothetical protein
MQVHVNIVFAIESKLVGINILAKNKINYGTTKLIIKTLSLMTLGQMTITIMTLSKKGKSKMARCKYTK